MDDKNWSLIDTLVLIIKNRVDKELLLSNIITSILTFYLFIFAFFWLVNYHIPDILSSFLFIIFLLLFAINITWFLRVVGGFQDSEKMYWFSFSIFLSFFWPYISSLLGKLKHFTFSLNEISPSLGIGKEALIALFVPIIVAVLVKMLTQFSRKKDNIFSKEEKVAEKYWSKLFCLKNNIRGYSILFFIFILVYFVPTGIILSENFEVNIQIIDLGLYLFLSLVFILFLRFFVYMPSLSKEIVDKLYSWHQFFTVYKGKWDNSLNKLNQLVKISGKCTAISYKGEFKELMCDDFCQQFLMIVDECNQEIQVVRLEEKNPFENSADIVKENDEIFIIGEMRQFYERWADTKKKNIFIAYHVFSKNNKSNEIESKIKNDIKSYSWKKLKLEFLKNKIL